jgi:hypothetical protein|tara:strand:- start:413 stop:640 length:228 start_codon:yes stop_codon:yes gene_type:complete
MLSEGDLVHIPQDVNMWDFTANGSMNVIKTEKPITGVFMGQVVADTCRVYALGRTSTVQIRHIYPMEEANASKTN